MKICATSTVPSTPPTTPITDMDVAIRIFRMKFEMHRSGEMRIAFTFLDRTRECCLRCFIVLTATRPSTKEVNQTKTVSIFYREMNSGAARTQNNVFLCFVHANRARWTANANSRSGHCIGHEIVQRTHLRPASVQRRRRQQERERIQFHPNGK